MCSTTNYNKPEYWVTGLGITTAIGQGKASFTRALLEGQHGFGVMQRPGRQNETAFLGAEIPALVFPDRLTRRVLRTASLTGQVALATLDEAWEEAKLEGIDPYRIGLVIGGVNLQQRELIQTHQSYQDRPQYLPPTYGFSFMDTDLCGLCTEQYGIRGFAYTAGGASASGQLAVLQAVDALETGRVDVCIAIGALMDISFWECQALRSLGAMGTDHFTDQPGEACRPFDRRHDGFIYGESCGVIVLERADSACRRGVEPYGRLSGWAIAMDGNRNPNPSYDGEVRVIRNALDRAGLTAREIDYINPHGTGSVIGDEIELKAIIDSGLSHAWLNATKSITGHGLTAAGAVEIVTVLLQMKEKRLHPTRNLEEPIVPSLHWVQGGSVAHDIQHALSLSMGFGGINTAVCLSRL